jgi:hypothetical protein
VSLDPATATLEPSGASAWPAASEATARVSPPVRQRRPLGRRQVVLARGRSADDISRVSTADYFAGKSGMAPRPSNSVLALEKIRATGFRPREWRNALQAYVDDGI